MKRQIITIDEKTCAGCGDCIPACPGKGARLAIKLGLRFREPVTAWGNRGLICCQTGDDQGAIEEFSAVIEARSR